MERPIERPEWPIWPERPGHSQRPEKPPVPPEHPIPPERPTPSVPAEKPEHRPEHPMVPPSEKPEKPGGPCGVGQGTLPGNCGALAFPFVAMQGPNPVRYSRREALETGTLFPGLNLPFKAAIQAKTQLANTALVELMALDFAIDELGLYLTTHANDQEALRLYWSYIQLAKEGREKYQQMYGPLLQTDLTPEEGYAWLRGPWPWEKGGND